jgi:IclR family transcriptional regulator, KDG regulon repressor
MLALSDADVSPAGGRSATQRAKTTSRSLPAMGSESAMRSELGTSVGKAMALLTAFDRSTPLGVSELSRKADVTKSTAHRLLAVLEELGLVYRDGSRYRLGTKLFELGNQVAYCCPSSLREVAHPYLDELHQTSRQTTHLAILDGSDVLYLDKLFGHDQVRTPSHVGGRAPAHCTALGKVLLAHASSPFLTLSGVPLVRRTRYTIVQPNLLNVQLDEAKTRGVAFDYEEAAIGLTCVAAPLRNRKGSIVAAISVSGSSSGFDPARLATRVSDVAAAISLKLFL